MRLVYRMDFMERLKTTNMKRDQLYNNKSNKRQRKFDRSQTCFEILTFYRLIQNMWNYTLFKEDHLF